MKITLLDPTGIPESEKEAFNKLEDALPDSWHGYGSYEMFQGKEGYDLDLVIISDDRIIVVELKNWFGEVILRNNSWIQVVRGKEYKNHGDVLKNVSLKRKILASKIKRKLEQKLSYTPWVEFCVVMCGKATFDELSEEIQESVFHLRDFLRIGKKLHFNSCFPKHITLHNHSTPNSKISLWNNFFIKNTQDFKPRKFAHNGYTQHGEAFFNHTNDIYSEYVANQNQYRAILRRWNWNAEIISKDAKTETDRLLFSERESRVLSYIDQHDTNDEDSSLSDLHLEYIPSQSPYAEAELYKWPKRLESLYNYSNTTLTTWTIEKRITIIKVFLSNLSRLHQIGVAHRDIGAHSIWVSHKSTRMQISNFIAATYPDDPNKQFIRNLRSTLLHVKTPTPEDLYDDDSGTPFTRDVYLAASVAHYLAFSKWPEKKDDVYYWSSLDEDNFKGSLNNWFSKSLELEPNNRFTDVTHALDSFNELTKKNHSYALNDDLLVDLKKYEVETNPYDIYAHSRLNTNNSPMLFKSNNECGLKLWTGVNQTNADLSINFRLLSFLDYISSLIKAKNSIVPTVKEFGYNDLFKFVFIAYEWVDGENWHDFVSKAQLEDVPSLILKLLKSIEKLHKNKIFIGNISPEKIICKQSSESIAIKFTNLFDKFSTDLESQDQEILSDDTIQTLSQASQDRLSIMNIVIETANSLGFNFLKENCEHLITDNGVSEGDFTNLIDNFNKALAPPEDEPLLEDYVITGRNFSLSAEVLDSDDGSYYIGVYYKPPPSGRTPQLTVSLTGRKYSFKFFVDIATKKITFGTKPMPIQHADFMINKRRCEIEMTGKITLVKDQNFIAEDFLEIIFNNNRTKEILAEINKPKQSTTKTIDIKPQLSESITTIWKTSVDTEFSTYPKIYLINSPKPEGKNLYSVQFSLESGNPDFDLSRGSNERVNILKIIENKDSPWRCGRIIKFDQGGGKSIGEMIYRVKESNQLEEGDELRLESNLVSSSLNKRKRAMDDIINERSAISNLAQYFDPNENCSITEFNENHPTDEELDLYTELDQHSEITFELNESQREAFKKLYSYGPLGLLQGPPGTGKTAFIGAFIHYAVNKGAKRILLISQSHEAVNGAAEKVRTIFEKLNQVVSIVRFGDEVNLSESLEDISEVALQDQYRELFRAEIKQRIINISGSLNLNDGFIYLAVEFELSFGQNLKSLVVVSENIESLNEEDLDNKKARAISLINKIEFFLTNKFNYKETLEINELDEVSDLFYKLLANKFDIHSPSRITKFRNIVNMSIEWIGVMSSSNSKFQNFLAKTRTVVCGTCVGIGRNHYGIDENIYDLVIIDEAARATSSELAISMNVGERVILVGDHKQLLPFIEPDHLDEIKKRLPNISRFELERSDFERSFLSNYGNEIKCQLSKQYRMAIPIGSLVSDCFYNGAISTGRGYSEEVFSQLPENLGSTVTWLDTSDAGEESYEHKFGEYKTENKYEADLIINLIKKLIEQPLLSDYFEPNNISPQIGVICMYKAQLNLLNRKGQSLQWFRNLINNGVVKIDTVDSYQGKENSIIITSLVRNNSRNDIGFLKLVNRANVALSRAKERLYIVGSTSIWNKENTEESFGKVLTYIKDNDPTYYKIMDSKNLGGKDEKTH